MITLMLSQPKLDTTSPVRAEAGFDPPILRPGEKAIYRVTLNALRDVISWDGKLPPVSKFEMHTGATGQTMQMKGTNFQPRTSFNFHATAPAEGKYTVPSFLITVGGKSVRVPEASFIAVNVATSAPPQMLYLEITPERPFVGEAARVRVLSPASPSGVVQALGQVQLVGKGFIQELAANKQSVQTLPYAGRTAPHYIYETTLTPISPGASTIYAQAFAVGNRFSGNLVITGPAVISANTLQYTLLDSEPIKVEFRPLPPEGRPPGFAGAVGVYSVDPPQLFTNKIHPGEPLRMTVSIRGHGNLGRLSLPEPPILQDWQVLPPRREELPIQVIDARGFASFTYTLVPLKGDLQATPQIPFSFFNPERESYVAQNIPAVPVTVMPGHLPSDLDALLQQRLAAADSKEPHLSPLATSQGAVIASLVPIQLRPWFPFVQAAPAVFFLGLWLWDRRRRFLETHPEVVLRRKARRELKRQRARMRAAARRGEASEFQRSAIQALQAVTAPTYPAHPEAMLSTDVLRLLDARAPEECAAVERVFQANNTEKYAGRNAANLIEEHERLDRALRILEEKL